jgi:hypothetical protein
MMTVRIGLLVFVSLVCAQSAFAASAVINGNFETGDLTGWDTRSSANNSLCHAWESVEETATPLNHYAVLDTQAQTEWTCDPFSGEWTSIFGWAFASINQLVTVAIGDKVTFDYTCDCMYDESVMTIWRDTTLLDTIPLSYSETWTSGSYTFQEAGSLFVEFSTSLPAGSALVRIDNVQLVPVPEPGTFGLLAIGTVICGTVARFRRK